MRIETPLGAAWVMEENGAVTAFGFGETERNEPVNPRTVRQLEEYFAGSRRAFDLPLAPQGSPFQKLVWAELARIPFGETISYAQLAERVGRLGAARAVGRANATNPIALIVPCHRVIGSDGKLTGYAYGVEIKEKLLAWEQSVACASQSRSAEAAYNQQV